MGKNISSSCIVLIFLILASCSKKSLSEFNEKEIVLGAYYFDGWSGLTHNHITKNLVDSFPEREPIWGWTTSQQDIINAQIDVASAAGIAFFSFCWYFPENKNIEDEPLNRALQMFLRAPNRDRLRFNLLVANHHGYLIGPNNWKNVSRYWLHLFKDAKYLKVDEKPLLTFFSMQTLIDSFGSVDRVKNAFDSLKFAARQSGLKGVNLAVCVSPDTATLNEANKCGFDVITGYNYHYAGFTPNEAVISIDKLITGSKEIWNGFNNFHLPYIPVATLNWDPRPWATPTNSLQNSPRYFGYSSNSVYSAIKSLRNWLNDASNNKTKEKIALIYAWNEYGEGAWLTPSKNNDENYLEGVVKALQ